MNSFKKGEALFRVSVFLKAPVGFVGNGAFYEGRF